MKNIENRSPGKVVGILENDDLAPYGLPESGNLQAAGQQFGTEEELVDENPVLDFQGADHGSRGDLVSLNEILVEQKYHHGGPEEGVQPVHNDILLFLLLLFAPDPFPSPAQQSFRPGFEKGVYPFHR